VSVLRRVRIDQRLSVVALAGLSGVSQEQIRNIETGRARNPRAATLGKLADALHVSPSELDPMGHPDEKAVA
jgi:transcriptional regulator with XRE-family HTH domain